MITIICSKDKIYRLMKEVCDKLESLEDKMVDKIDAGERIPEDYIIEFCVLNAELEELLRMRREGL